MTIAPDRRRSAKCGGQTEPRDKSEQPDSKGGSTTLKNIAAFIIFATVLTQIVSLAESDESGSAPWLPKVVARLGGPGTSRNLFLLEHAMSILNLDEIVPGVVVYFVPRDLEARGTDCRRSAEIAMDIISLSIRERYSFNWVMLTSQGWYGKYLIPNDCKVGHRSWADRTTFVCGRETMLEASNWDIQAASSSDQSANMIASGSTKDALRRFRGFGFVGCK